MPDQSQVTEMAIIAVATVVHPEGTVLDEDGRPIVEEQQ